MNILKNLYFLYKLLKNVKVTAGKDRSVTITCSCISVEIWEREVRIIVNGLLQVDPMFLSVCQHFYDKRKKDSQEEDIIWLYRDIANMTNEQEREQAYRAVYNKIDPGYSKAAQELSQGERVNQK